MKRYHVYLSCSSKGIVTCKCGAKFPTGEECPKAVRK